MVSNKTLAEKTNGELEITIVSECCALPWLQRSIPWFRSLHSLNRAISKAADRSHKLLKTDMRARESISPSDTSAQKQVAALQQLQKMVKVIFKSFNEKK